jgi:hypothetical protein
MRLKKPFTADDINTNHSGETMVSALCTAALGAAALGICGSFALPAQAAYVVSMQEVPAGGITNVVASRGGTIDLTDLSLAATNRSAARRQLHTRHRG